MRLSLLSLAVWAVLSASPSLGCGFHTYMPQPTMVDRLLNSDHIVLARPDPGNPFRFAAVKAVEGPLENVELPHLVDSTTRRRFKADSDAHVLFARDGAYGPWERIAYIDAEMDKVLDHVIAHLPEWRRVGEDTGRYIYFGGLIDNPSPRVRRLALRELDQASYGALRSLDIAPEPEGLAAQLGILTESDLAPIRILLLGLTDSPEVTALLQAGVNRTKTSGASALLGAYATAWVEHAGLVAVNELAAEYLTDRSLPFESREMIVEALAIHAEVRDPATAEAVRSAVSSAVQADPRIAIAVARQFGLRNDWTMRSPVSEVLQAKKLSSITDIIIASQYVALADEASQTQAN